MGLFFNENNVDQTSQISKTNWDEIETFMLEYSAISRFIITTQEGLPIISQDSNYSEVLSSKISSRLDDMQSDFEQEIKHLTISLEDKTFIVYKKYGFIFITEYTEGSEEMVKRRLLNALSTYEKFFVSYYDYI